jgi:hypothetical protein
VFVGPIPKLRELRRRSTNGREVFPMLSQHFSERHPVSGDAVRIRAAFEQMQRIRVCVAMIKSHFRAIEQQGITSGVRFPLGHRRIDIGTVIQQQLEPSTLIVWVITKIPVDIRMIGRPNSSRAFGFPPASSMLCRRRADPCTALAIANESRWPLVKFGSAPSDNNVFIDSTNCGRCHDSVTAQQSNVVPSRPGACKSGTAFAAARIAS